MPLGPSPPTEPLCSAVLTQCPQTAGLLDIACAEGQHAGQELSSGCSQGLLRQGG